MANLGFDEPAALSPINELGDRGHPSRLHLCRGRAGPSRVLYARVMSLFSEVHQSVTPFGWPISSMFAIGPSCFDASRRTSPFSMRTKASRRSPSLISVCSRSG